MTTLRIAASVFLCGTLSSSLAQAQSEPSSPGATPQDEQSQQLARDEKKDSGRIFEIFWANAEAGFGYVNMKSFNENNLSIQNSSSSGGMFGLGAGIRLLVLTFGVRARLNELSAFNLWETNGEIGLHIPIQKWDPYISFHGGYTFVGTLNSSALSTSLSSSASDISIHGADAGISLGTDYYIIPYLSVGLDLSAEALFLSRPPASLPAGFSSLPAAEQTTIMAEPLYKDSGDAAGIGASGSFHVGLHI